MKARKWKFQYETVALLVTTIFFFSACQKKKSANDTALTLPRGNYDLVKMANGAVVQAHVLPSDGTNNALITAATADAYGLQLTLSVTIPSPAITVTDLCAATPELVTALPKLDSMVPQALLPNEKAEQKASPFYTTLFNNKIKTLEHQLSHLGQLAPRESLYDCQTILSLTNKETQASALLIQAIMNVNADGSDGDRNIPLEKLSSTYQPQTNYRWPKISARPNPNITELEQQLTSWQQTLSNPISTPEQKEKLSQQIAATQSSLRELKRWSFLIGSADPFIVLPKFMLDPKNSTSAAIGDYALVLYQGIIYPAIVGDIGPSSKIGEASLRLCRAIDPHSGADHRPSSSPHISYFVFPKSAELPFKAPDYAHWSDRCHQLWKTLGGSDSLPWHEWEKIDQPWSEEKKSEAPQIPSAISIGSDALFTSTPVPTH